MKRKSISGCVSFLCAAAFLHSDPLLNAQRLQSSAQDVNRSEIRKKQGLNPGENLLFNGWGLTPAGHHIPVSDLALKMIVSPDKKSLLAVHGGFNRHGV